MANVIYRGPIEREPSTVNLPVAGAYLPGIMVTKSASALTVATASDMEEELLVLSNVRFKEQAITTAYASGDTGVAYVPQVNDVFQVRLAAATYAIGDLLTIGASGYLAKAASGNVVYARFDGTAGAKSAGDLDDCKIANSFVVA